MDKKSTKKYLISLLLLWAGGFALSFFIMRAFSARLPEGAALSSQAIVLYSFLLSLLPAGSFSGFVYFGLRLIEKGEPNKGVKIAVCIFFPITLAFITASGIILIIPSIIKSFITLIRG